MISLRFCWRTWTPRGFVGLSGLLEAWRLEEERELEKIYTQYWWQPLVELSKKQVDRVTASREHGGRGGTQG